MTPKILFTLAVIVAAAAVIKYGYNTNGDELKKKGKGIWVGIILFTLALVTPVWVFGAEHEARWFNETEIFIGVDYARKTSPVCIEGGGDKVGSHGGLNHNLLTYGTFKANLTYLHESCAVAEDDKTKDAFLLDFRFQLTEDLIPWL